MKRYSSACDECSVVPLPESSSHPPPKVHSPSDTIQLRDTLQGTMYEQVKIDSRSSPCPTVSCDRGKLVGIRECEKVCRIFTVE